jgi:hypothetical protein
MQANEKWNCLSDKRQRWAFVLAIDTDFRHHIDSRVHCLHFRLLLLMLLFPSFLISNWHFRKFGRQDLGGLYMMEPFDRWLTAEEKGCVILLNVSTHCCCCFVVHSYSLMHSGRPKPKQNYFWTSRLFSENQKSKSTTPSNCTYVIQRTRLKTSR